MKGTWMFAWPGRDEVMNEPPTVIIVVRMRNDNAKRISSWLAKMTIVE